MNETKVAAIDNENLSKFLIGFLKANSGNFSILARIARDVLTIPISTVPISTVASKSTFSTNERVIDPFRCPLYPQRDMETECIINWYV